MTTRYWAEPEDSHDSPLRNAIVRQVDGAEPVRIDADYIVRLLNSAEATS